MTTTALEVLVSFMLQTHPQHPLLAKLFTSPTLTSTSSNSKQQRDAFALLALTTGFCQSLKGATAAFTAVELGSFEKWKEAVGK